MTNGGWEVHIHRSIGKVVYALPKQLALLIRNTIIGVQKNPHQSGSHPVEDLYNTYALFVEDYRIVYEIQEEKRLIKVAMVNLSLAED